ncbi:MAG TPA: DNA gyrase inhibitor YacG [Rhizomicrobium sp.]|jgi:hypothetical protein
MSEQQADNKRKCAVCGKPQDAAFRPFCSKRCADIDLGKWLKGTYVLPGDELPDSEGQGIESGDVEN